MNNKILDELRELLLSNNSSDVIKEELSNYHYSDIVDVLEELTKEERLKIYEIIGEEETAELMAYYDDPEVYLKELSIDEAVDLIELMDTDDAVDVLNEFEESDKEKIIELLDEEIQESVKMIESYSEDEIGSYMSDNFITISKDSTIKSAMKQMIDMAGEHDNIYTLYVTDNNKYYGAVSLRDLITARKDDSFEDLIKTGYPSFYDTDIMSECLEKIKDYSENSIPVISKDNEILGVLTTDSLVEATTDEFEEDYAKFAGLSEEEEMDESVGKSIKKRIPWLIILLFMGLLVSSVIGIFEGVITQVPIIVFFQSMVLGMAGNVGTQSLAVTIRNISNEDLKNDAKKQRKNILKELRIGTFNGLLIGLISFVFISVYLLITKANIHPETAFSIIDCAITAGIIGVSMMLSIIISSVIGTVFPLLLSKMKIDPAVASGPFITTLNDISSVVIYYGLAYLLFFILL